MFTPRRSQTIAALLFLLASGRSYAQATLGAPSATDAAAPQVAAPAAPPVVLPPPLPPPAMPAPAAVAAAPVPWRLDPAALYASVYPSSHGCADGPPACAPYEDRNGPLLIGDPLLDNCPATPGWLGDVELAGVVPHIKNRLTQAVTLNNGVTETVHLPTAELGARVMPTVALGYRLGQGAGEILVSYRFIVADGSENASAADLPGFGGAGAAVRSRLNFQVLDVDYGNYEPALGPGWDMKWRIGIRSTMNYADSQGTSGGSFEQTTNRFWGIGPHAALDLRRWLGNSDLAAFGRVDMSLPIGRLAQNFIDITPAGAGESRLFENLPLLSINGQIGLAWCPGRGNNFRVTAGYTWEHWWDVGSVGVFGATTREELNIQGGFLRAEWNY